MTAPTVGALRDVAPSPVVRRRRWRERGLALALLLPSIVAFGTWVYYPFARTIWLGLFRTSPFGNRTTYVGLEQYRDVLTSSDFHNSLWVTLLFTLMTVPVGLALGLGLAVLAHQRLAGIGAYRTIFSSTVATSVAVASLMFIALLSPSVGLINQIIKGMGREPVYFLERPGWALIAIAAVTVWQNLGVTFIVISAGLQSVPDDLYESARLDGAGAWSRFVDITLPLLSPTLLFGFVVLTITSFQTFGQVDLLTNGGPLDATNLIVFSIYTEGFRNFNPGVAAAQAVVLFLIVLALSVVQLKVLERRVFYG
ncbi:carbohydrate ABC transporter permease [Actinomarinicola tropica]|uniref:ABC transporter permease subunit n=1 Tax=Actinomarinicola tropica TaxID=2789776 RepID=A0A5Q2RG96_9ACTN|nr:sugar ABC transporter permease [Actinomarinicola tropica]QGG94733.1 ABC transporter permease subunit [Actinomarinicola tropica]